MQDDEKGYPENFGLIELINPVAFASATKDVRFYLNGIHIEIRDGLLTATAANGHRCASITHPIRHKDASEIFPIHAFKAIGKLSGMDSTLIGNPIKLSGNSTEAYIRPLDSKYPDLKGMLKPAVTAATMNREVFLDQLRSMAAVCGKTPKMDMEWSDSSVRIAMKNSDGIESNGELDCDHEDDGKISVNAEYFIEAVSSLKEEDFTMEFPENRKYIIIQEDNLTNIVMPIL
ncbi:MAG: DNA polymerase III subunit beta family protein [Gammaproteobacteria bacterium]